VKLHLGNGTVYLDGYVNVDLHSPLAYDHPDLVARNKTTVAKYYKFPFRANKDNNVCDVTMDIRTLAYPDDSADEILTVNTLDHMTKEDAMRALVEWKRVLKPGGQLIIDVDDRQKQAQILTSAETVEEVEWALRLIYCDHAAAGRTHWWGYTPAYLKDLLTRLGFQFKWVREDYIIHDMYPNFQICVTK
jgi:predicted SAM-dependent methyltransferase